MKLKRTRHVFVKNEHRDLVIEECAKCIPTTWLDPLLTGPKAVAEFKDCPSVERLLQAVAVRIRSLSSTHTTGE
jgi:hypothetical protein